MMRCRTQAPKIKNYLDSSNEFYQNLLSYKPEQTSLQQVQKSQWNEFAQQRGLNPNSSGIYLPRNQTAIIKEQNPLSLFHEYFGHGLYCEQSLAGRKLVDLEKKLLEEEKQKFNKRKFSLEDVQRFRKQNKTFKELDNFRKNNLARYELFAIFTEYLLSKEFSINEMFEKKYDGLSDKNKEQVEEVITFNNTYGNLATFYEFGLARRTTPKRVRRLLEDVYGVNKTNNSKLILLTGSKKPFSDIDLFASSNYLHSIKNSWLDLVSFNEKDFERRIKLFEVQVTHPILTGEYIAGDKNYLKQKRKQLQEQPITKEAIQHNFRKAEQERIASEETNEEELKRIYISYSQTYLANALALRQGKRILIKEKLLYSQSESFIELKGGIN